MSWTEPKITWTGASGEYFNVDDYTRIKGNIEYLSERISATMNYVAINSMKTYVVGAIPKYYELNRVTSNVAKLMNACNGINYFFEYTQYWSTMRTLKAGGTAWNYIDLNAIEHNLLIIYDFVESVYATKVKLPTKLGIREVY